MLSGEKMLLLIMLCVAAAGIASLSLHYLRRNRLRRAGVPSAAHVSDVKTERILRSETTDRSGWDAVDRFLNKRRYTYTLCYTVGGKSYTRDLVREEKDQQYMAGDAVDIVYNPDNPKQMMTVTEVHASGAGARLISLNLLIVAALILFFLLGR